MCALALNSMLSWKYSPEDSSWKGSGRQTSVWFVRVVLKAPTAHQANTKINSGRVPSNLTGCTQMCAACTGTNKQKVRAGAIHAAAQWDKSKLDNSPWTFLLIMLTRA